MDLKFKLVFPILVALALVIVFIVVKNNNASSLEHTSTVNDDIAFVQSFNLSAGSTDLNTSVQGTIFVKENNSIQIAAFVDIDPEDWGGVAFYIPNGWIIANISSNYPEQQQSANNVSIWTTTDAKWNTMIEVGRNREYKQSEGGRGTVIIDLVPSSNTRTDVERSISVEVGSSEVNGVKTMGTDFIEIPISFGQK